MWWQPCQDKGRRNDRPIYIAPNSSFNKSLELGRPIVAMDNPQNPLKDFPFLDSSNFTLIIDYFFVLLEGKVTIELPITLFCYKDTSICYSQLGIHNRDLTY